mgnify:CR=1 FL=1
MVESTWTWINHFVLWLSIVGYFGFIVVYSMFSSYVPVFFGVTLQILSSVEAWLVIALVVGRLCVLHGAATRMAMPCPHMQPSTRGWLCGNGSRMHCRRPDYREHSSAVVPDGD